MVSPDPVHGTDNSVKRGGSEIMAHPYPPHRRFAWSMDQHVRCCLCIRTATDVVFAVVDHGHLNIGMISQAVAKRIDWAVAESGEFPLDTVDLNVRSDTSIRTYGYINVLEKQEWFRTPQIL